jgi:uroporphyrin-III C-methyltransferase/precorrin-2 dehydrogenase/sirohydrochlorin ferrochelatase
LKLAGRTVLVVGAGAVAERKIEALLEAGAHVRVVAPDASPRVHELASAGSLEWSARPFVESDADGTWLVVAATADAEVQQGVAAAAEARRIFAVAVDDPANASAYSAAVVVRPPLTVAISSSGALPALTRLLREILEDVLPADDWIEHARALRARWLADKTPATDRFGDLVRELAAKRP